VQVFNVLRLCRVHTPLNSSKTRTEIQRIKSKTKEEGAKLTYGGITHSNECWTATSFTYHNKYYYLLHNTYLLLIYLTCYQTWFNLRFSSIFALCFTTSWRKRLIKYGRLEPNKSPSHIHCNYREMSCSATLDLFQTFQTFDIISLGILQPIYTSGILIGLWQYGPQP